MVKRKNITGSTAGMLLLGTLAFAHQGASAADAASDDLRKALEEQVRRLEIEKRNLAEQEAQLKRTRQALLETENKINALLGQVRGTGTGAPVVAQAAAQEPTAPVGQPPAEPRAPQVAPIFEQRGVLTPRGQVVLEPSLQYAYSSGSRIALAGYTIIPAFLIGVVDVREVK